VDENMKPIPGTEQFIKCDTLLLSVGLIPENELSTEAEVKIDPRTGGALVNQNLETSVEGIFACGNVLHVHDLVDYVAMEAAHAAESAADRICGKLKNKTKRINIITSEGIRYTVPQHIDKTGEGGKIKIYFRSSSKFGESELRVTSGDDTLLKKKYIKLFPAEMEYITIDTGKIEGDELRLEAVGS
jgi:pyruvate/2-oxoglutarate dehydrogenase complex dihydrolipoamide dehydrogenase (E3) component